MSGSSSARGAVTVARLPGKSDTEASSELASLRELLEADPDAFEAAGLPIPAPDDRVTAVLISHDGARWLPETLAALAAQTRPPDSVVAVDTGSSDTSVALVRAALGDATVIEAPARTGFGAAVALGLAGQRTQPHQPAQPHQPPSPTSHPSPAGSGCSTTIVPLSRLHSKSCSARAPPSVTPGC